MAILCANKIHFRVEDHYLCNRACNITESKCTGVPDKVTCLNCKRALWKTGVLKK